LNWIKSLKIEGEMPELPPPPQQGAHQAAIQQALRKYTQSQGATPPLVPPQQRVPQLPPDMLNWPQTTMPTRIPQMPP
jgi:hypothetical protein